MSAWIHRIRREISLIKGRSINISDWVPGAEPTRYRIVHPGSVVKEPKIVVPLAPGIGVAVSVRRTTKHRAAAIEYGQFAVRVISVAFGDRPGGVGQCGDAVLPVALITTLAVWLARGALVLAAVGLAAIVWLLIAVKCRFDSARADLASRAGARGTSIGKATAGWWPARAEGDTNVLFRAEGDTGQRGTRTFSFGRSSARLPLGVDFFPGSG